MNNNHAQRLTRRAVIGAGSAALAGSWIFRVSGSQRDVVEGDCESDEAVAMLLAWQRGEFLYPSIADAGPGSDWVPFEQPESFDLVFIPPDWTGVVAWADSFSRYGTPIWQDRQTGQPQLVLSRILSPDGKAWFETVIGPVLGTLLSAQDASLVARQGSTGDNPRLRSICAVDRPGDAMGPSWFTADRHRTNLMISMGTVLQMPHQTLPITALAYNTLYMPRRDSEQLMYDVFLRILRQFLKKPAGGDTSPTPTPTPAP